MLIQEYFSKTFLLQGDRLVQLEIDQRLHLWTSEMHIPTIQRLLSSLLRAIFCCPSNFPNNIFNYIIIIRRPYLTSGNICLSLCQWIWTSTIHERGMKIFSEDSTHRLWPREQRFCLSLENVSINKNIETNTIKKRNTTTKSYHFRIHSFYFFHLFKFNYLLLIILIIYFDQSSNCLNLCILIIIV